jgi:hypothetical protein
MNREAPTSDERAAVLDMLPETGDIFIYALPKRISVEK